MPRTRREGGKPRKDLQKTEDRRVTRVMDNLTAPQVVFERKLVLVSTVSTNGSGYIAAIQVTSDSCRSAADWGSIAARYSQFRVKAIRIRLVPTVDYTQAAAGSAVTPHPGAIGMAKYMEGLGYASFSQVMSGQDSKLFNGREAILEHCVTWDGVPEAKLWSETAAAIPSAQQYGIQYQDSGVGPASAASTVYFRTIQEYVVQFTVPR